jgi:protein-S-isoprenylcysteine O-methyltransferase Ste14
VSGPIVLAAGQRVASGGEGRSRPVGAAGGAELKSMRTRITLALTGVLALAILRAGAFLALAAGATILTWAPIPALPWFTWGVWLFLLVTRVQFIGGWGFYKGSWTAIRTRTTARDWRSFGAFTGFLVALFVEMYGFPLTIYLLSGWLQRRYPGMDLLSHDAGHLWDTILGWQGNPHLNPLHVLSNVFIAGGFILLARSWSVLYAAQQQRELATTGPYAYVRHPQYAAFIVIMFGFLLQWPTLLTLVMFPILTAAYVRLARREEREVLAVFGEAFARYVAVTPAFIPRFRGHMLRRA